MMSQFVRAISASGCLLLLGTADPLVLGLSVQGLQLPEIDTSTSMIGQIAFLISSRIEAKYPHQTITHSLLATLVIASSFEAITLRSALQLLFIFH